MKEPKGARGFASMDPQKVRELAKKGGQTAHRLKKAHQFTPEEARAASLKRHDKAHYKAIQEYNP